jgi:hypothetical protein
VSALGPLSVPSVANLRVAAFDVDSSEPFELASGVDALYLSGHGYLSKGFLALLEEHRMWADRGSIQVPFELGPLTFGLAPHGWGKYRYCLEHESGRIGFTKSARLPAIRVQPRAEFLQTHGPAGVVAHFDSLLRPVVENLGFSVARVDLFCDLENLKLSAQDRLGFLCRGTSCTTYEAGRVCTGFAFGSRRNGHISARIYDKTAEMEAKGTDWWGAVWAERHLVGTQVWRIEFEIGRAALNELELHRPDDVLAAIPSLWRYASTEWLTLRVPGADSNRSRWPLDERWRAAQSASLVHGATELKFIRGHKRAQSFRRLMPALVGYLVNFAVLSKTACIDDTLAALGARLRDDEAVRRIPFAQRVQQRRAEVGYKVCADVEVVREADTERRDA